MAGTTIYNVLALAEVELSESEPDRPVYPPKLHSIEVVENPFPDIVPRITRQERESQEHARRQFANSAPRIPAVHKKKKKNTALLSFGDEEDVPAGPRHKGISSHDLLQDARLSKDTIATAAPISKTPLSRQDNVSKPQNPPFTSTTTGAEIHVLEEQIRHRARDAAHQTSRPAPKKSLLALLTDEYRQKPKNNERDTLTRLENFRRNAGNDEPKRKRLRVTQDNAWTDDQAHEYGTSDDDDTDWRSHRCVAAN